MHIPARTFGYIRAEDIRNEFQKKNPDDPHYADFEIPVEKLGKLSELLELKEPMVTSFISEIAETLSLYSKTTSN